MCTAVLHASPRAPSSAATPHSRDLVEIHVESRLVELDHVHAGGLDLARLLVRISANAMASFSRLP